MSTSTSISNHQRAPRVYAFLDEDRIDFATFGMPEREQSAHFAYHTHAIAPDQLLTEALHEALQQCPLLQGTPKDLCVVANSRTLLVPLNSCSAAEAQTLYYFNYPHLQGARVLEDHLSTLGAAVLFSVAPVVDKVISTYVSAPYYVSAATPLLAHFAAKPNYREAATIYVSMHRHDVEVMAFVGARFWAHNKFAVNTPEDVAYYAMAMLGDTGIATDKASYYFCGESPLRDAALQFLRGMTPKAHLLTASEEFDHPALRQHTDLPYALAVQIFASTSH